MEAIQLSDNFWLGEFIRSQTAARMGRAIVVEPGDAIHLNLVRLCREVLQPLRDRLGPIHVTSGYRPVWLNRKIGGSRRSQHCLGLAADIVVTGHSPYQVCEAAVSHGLPFDQLIHEFGQWVHVSVAPEGELPRGETLTAVKVPRAIPGLKPKTRYVAGLWRPEDALAMAA